MWERVRLRAEATVGWETKARSEAPLGTWGRHVPIQGMNVQAEGVPDTEVTQMAQLRNKRKAEGSGSGRRGGDVAEGGQREKERPGPSVGASHARTGKLLSEAGSRWFAAGRRTMIWNFLTKPTAAAL